MKKRKLTQASVKRSIIFLIILSILLTVYWPTIVSGRRTPTRARTRLSAKGKGLIIYGYNWHPPYPGEPFFIGDDDPTSPFAGMLGEPEWSAKLDESKLNFIGKSTNLDEQPVRTGTPYELPTELTKLWLYEMTGTGTLEASWTREDQENKLEIKFRDVTESVTGLWVGTPATCKWSFYAAGAPNTMILRDMSFAFSGKYNDEQIEGYITVSYWPDIMMANLWIDDGEEGSFINILWVNPKSYTTHYWLAYWLGEEIGLPEFGYEEGKDPFATWVPPAEKFKINNRIH